MDSIEAKRFLRMQQNQEAPWKDFRGATIKDRCPPLAPRGALEGLQGCRNQRSLSSCGTKRRPGRTSGMPQSNIADLLQHQEAPWKDFRDVAIKHRSLLAAPRGALEGLQVCHNKRSLSSPCTTSGMPQSKVADLLRHQEAPWKDFRDAAIKDS